VEEDMAEETKTPEVSPVVVSEELQEKKVKKAFIEKFKLVKKPEDNGGVSEAEAITEDIRTDEEQIYTNLAKVKASDYVIWRVRKRTILVVCGALVALMWIAILGRMGIENYLPRFAYWNPEIREKWALSQIPTPTPTPEASPAARLKIRIRDNSEASGSAQILADLLINQGFAKTEVVDDHQSEYVGISVITKTGDQETRPLLESALQAKYTLASPSAELTNDSDFDAVILFAPVKIVVTPTRRPTPTTQVATNSALTR
jgi:hypothetical protein